MEGVTVYIGDCIESLKKMDDESIDCCVTSPPYWGLRDYGADGQLGLEKTPEEYVSNMVAVFQEVRRVLKEDGTLWLNLGDSYTATTRGGSSIKFEGRDKTAHMFGNREIDCGSLKPKDLVGIPWRVAFALQADGWYLRQDIIWHKPNPMPESVRDRCTKAHEYIFLLAKAPRYYFDSEAIKEPATYAGKVVSLGEKSLSKGQAKGASVNPSGNALADSVVVKETRNRRSVWKVTTRPYKGAHFAVYPPELIRPCVKAGCRPGGTVLDPFGGSGTTAQVAIEEGRKAVLCELNPEYAALIEKRISEVKHDT